MIEPEELENITCTRRNQIIAEIRVLWYGDSTVDLCIAYENDIIECDTLSLNEYRRIKDLCEFYNLGHEKTY